MRRLRELCAPFYARMGRVIVIGFQQIFPYESEHLVIQMNLETSTSNYQRTTRGATIWQPTIVHPVRM